MDIRSIIDSEDTPPTRKSSLPAQTKQEYRPRSIGVSNAQAPACDNRRDIRAPQPLPLQTSAHNESYFPASSSQDSAQSPYQRAPSYGLNSGPYPPLQAPHHSPHHGQQVLQYPQRENSLPSAPQSGRSFGHSTPISQTPTASTPGSASAYSNFPRPTSSHSIPTPNSANHSSSYLKESPQASLTQTRSFSQPQGALHHVSQPATPLGPPTIYGRPSFNPHRESPGEHRHRRSPSGSHHSQQEFLGPPPADSGSPPSYREQSSNIQGYENLRQREQSLSVSPKTRLPSLPSINRTGSLEGPSDPQIGRNGHAVSKQMIEVDIPGSDYSSKPRSARKPSQSIGVSGLLNEEPPIRSPESVYHASHNPSPPSNENGSDVQFLGRHDLSQPIQPHSSPPQSRTYQQLYANSPQHPPVQDQHPTKTVPNHRTSDSVPHLLPKSEPVSSFKMAALKTSSNLIDAPLPSVKKASASRRTKRPIQESPETDAPENNTAMVSQPVKKKIRVEGPQDPTSPAVKQKVEPPPLPKKPKVPRITRWQDVPVFAQSIRGPQRTMELFQQNLTGTNRGAPAATSIPSATAALKPSNQTNGPMKSQVPVPSQSLVPNGVPALPNQPSPVNAGPLGPWECSVTDTEPADEVTRIIADFLFPNVVMNNEVGVAPAGGGRGLGAVLEIEAKIGRLIDRNTNDRLRLPVMNECVINHADPNLRIAFESSMTEHQHRNLNQFLNKALVDSQGPKQGAAPPRKPRIPMTYKHTKEVDTFYEISQHGALQLPRSVASGLQLNPNARHKAKVRVTTNEKTGEELAKIVKTRVADIDVYSPRTLFDWRVSVNVEMDFDIDMKDLVAVEKRDGKADRRKDRVSYKHLQYQIDLTQVMPAEPVNKLDKEHELEIEVSSAEVRKQGLLVMNNQFNGYEDLIKGFVDNVRLLARYCKE